MFGVVDCSSELVRDGSVGQHPLEFVVGQKRVVSSLHHEFVDPLRHDQEIREVNHI